jgi:predicted lipid-binding transport protein (Tim44 family)
MPGSGVVHRVIFIKVCLAVLWLWLSTPVLAGVGPGVDTFANISQWQASAAPAKAGRWPASRQQQSPSRDQSPAPSSHYPRQGKSGLLKFLAGGLLGGLLYALLFGYPLSLYWSLGNWPVGFLDLVAVTTAAYVGYRLLRPGHFRGGARPIPGFPLTETMGAAVFTIKNEAAPALAKFSHADPAFDLQTFVEHARQLVFDLHEAWNHEDLTQIKDRLTEPLLEALQVGLKIIGLRGEISRVEDLALSQIVVETASQGEGWDTIAVQFQGRVVDYVLERRSFKLISGSMGYPERLQECWIFERPRGQRSWLLADIQDPLVLAKVIPLKVP